MFEMGMMTRGARRLAVVGIVLVAGACAQTQPSDNLWPSIGLRAPAQEALQKSSGVGTEFRVFLHAARINNGLTLHECNQRFPDFCHFVSLSSTLEHTSGEMGNADCHASRAGWFDTDHAGSRFGSSGTGIAAAIVVPPVARV